MLHDTSTYFCLTKQAVDAFAHLLVNKSHQQRIPREQSVKIRTAFSRDRTDGNHSARTLSKFTTRKILTWFVILDRCRNALLIKIGIVSSTYRTASAIYRYPSAKLLSSLTAIQVERPHQPSWVSSSLVNIVVASCRRASSLELSISSYSVSIAAWSFAVFQFRVSHS